MTSAIFVVHNDRGAIWRSWDYTKQRCLFCYLCFCLPNSTGDIASNI